MPGKTRAGCSGVSRMGRCVFSKIPAGPYLYRAHGPRVVENFLDVAHFPFVHMGYLGDPSQTEVGDYEAKIREDGVVTQEIPVWQPDPDGNGKSAKVAYTFHVPRPLTATFMKVHGKNRFAMFSCVTPAGERESIVWLIMALNYAQDVRRKSAEVPRCGHESGRAGSRIAASRIVAARFAGGAAFARRPCGHRISPVVARRWAAVRHGLSEQNCNHARPA